MKNSGRFCVIPGVAGVYICLEYWSILENGAPAISSGLTSTEIEYWLKDTIEELELVAKEAKIVALRAEAEPILRNSNPPKNDED